jgi:hypothetical protein
LAPRVGSDADPRGWTERVPVCAGEANRVDVVECDAVEFPAFGGQTTVAGEDRPEGAGDAVSLQINADAVAGVGSALAHAQVVSQRTVHALVAVGVLAIRSPGAGPTRVVELEITGAVEASAGLDLVGEAAQGVGPAGVGLEVVHRHAD